MHTPRRQCARRQRCERGRAAPPAPPRPHRSHRSGHTHFATPARRRAPLDQRSRGVALRLRRHRAGRSQDVPSGEEAGEGGGERARKGGGSFADPCRSLRQELS